MSQLRSNWARLGLAGAVLLAGMLLVAPRYGKAQTAVDSAAFRAVVGDERSRFMAAAVLDIGFAAVYPLFAVACALHVGRRWPQLLGRLGAGMVVLGGALDEVENAFVIWNLMTIRSVDDAAIDRMTAVGPAKWSLGVVGAAVVLGCVLAGRRRGGSE